MSVEFRSLQDHKFRAGIESESDSIPALNLWPYSNWSGSGSCGTRSHTFKDHLRCTIIKYPALRGSIFRLSTPLQLRWSVKTTRNVFLQPSNSKV